MYAYSGNIKSQSRGKKNENDLINHKENCPLCTHIHKKCTEDKWTDRRKTYV